MFGVALERNISLSNDVKVLMSAMSAGLAGTFRQEDCFELLKPRLFH